MYKDDKKNIGWLKILVKIIILFLVFMLVIKLISMGIAKFKDKDDNSLMKANLKVMDTVAKDFFKGDELPTELGKSTKVTLKDLVDKKLIEELKDEDGNTCSLEASFIQATRLDTEYQLKSYLECGSESDYQNSFIKIEDENPQIKPVTTTTKKTTTKKTTSTTKKVTNSTTTKVSTTKKTTKKPTTTTKKTTTTKVTTTTTTRPTVSLYYVISFNTNGGKFVPSQYIKPGSKMAKVIPTRPGYKFLGWYYNGKEFNQNTNIYRDYVLVAKWVKE